MGGILSQFFFIPAARITEHNCPDQSGRVIIVTGGYTGVGFEFSKILYAQNATVYIAGRSQPKASDAIASIKKAVPRSSGHLELMSIDLSDLSTIGPAVENFTAKNDRLDVLVNNAGVMVPPKGSTDRQGNDLQVGTNCLGHYLLYKKLSPLLTKTAALSATGSVRVLWAASIAVQVVAPTPGMILHEDGQPTDQGVEANYAQTKVGNAFLARELAKTTPQTGVVHAAFNPGNLKTELQRHWEGIGKWFTMNFICYPAVYGAYTELWAAIAPEITPQRSGAYVYPWGRFGELPAGVEKSLKTEEGTGVSAKFVAWCEKKTEDY